MRTQSVVSLDPIDRSRKREPGFLGRIFMTRHFRGKGMSHTDEFGHYLFCGAQRSGKTVSCIWFAEFLTKKYHKHGLGVILYSNIGLGLPITRDTLSPIIRKIQYARDTVHIFVIDELQSYFPKDTKNIELLKLIDELTGEFSQLGKRQIYVLSTAQIYGRVNKNLREQCLYMINCRRSKLSNKVVNDFIRGEDIMCDDLGRWSGSPCRIYVHGLPEMQFDTHKMVLE